MFSRFTPRRGLLPAFRNRMAATLCLLAPLAIPAQASVHDWECLTADLSGSSAARLQFVTAGSEAASVFDIAPAILVAIKRVESGLGLNPLVLNHNSNGTVDRGFFQVNTEVWIPELQRIGTQVQTGDLHSVRKNALIAAWILRRQINRSDVPSVLEAVGYYHKGGGTSARAKRIRKAYTDKFMKQLKVLVSRCGGGGYVTAQR